jgi:hypothetical protein
MGWMTLQVWPLGQQTAVVLPARSLQELSLGQQKLAMSLLHDV